MKVKKSAAEFKTLLSKVQGSTVEPERALTAMFDFYGAVRADGCDLEADGNMLLFQWGTFDWGKGPRFELDLTRQFMVAGRDDDEIWQLHLTFFYPPEASLAALESGNHWCHQPSDLPTFRALVMDHAAVRTTTGRAGAKMSIRLENAG